MPSSYDRASLLPEVQSLLEAIAAMRPDPRVLEAEALRAADPLVAMAFNVGAPAMATETEIRIPGPGGELRALVFAGERRHDERLPVVLHMHGGGFVSLTPECTAKVCKLLALATGALFVSLDYRRAPEHPFPEPLDDCVAAFRWLRAHAGSLGGDAARIAVAGDSAGANLAAATALRIAAAGEAPPSGALLMCPVTDLAFETRSFRAFGPDDAIIDAEVMAFYRSCYAPDASAWRNPLVSPLRADLSSFPPACVVVGGIDPLYDDGVRFARRIERQGRSVVLHEYPGMPHDFMLFPALEPLTDVISQMTAFLRDALAPPADRGRA
ncbi:MAG: alpha/beta hydrolase [Dehalococcoidia bacterium]